MRLPHQVGRGNPLTGEFCRQKDGTNTPEPNMLIVTQYRVPYQLTLNSESAIISRDFPGASFYYSRKRIRV